MPNGSGKFPVQRIMYADEQLIRRRVAVSAVCTVGSKREDVVCKDIQPRRSVRTKGEMPNKRGPRIEERNGGAECGKADTRPAQGIGCHTTGRHRVRIRVRQKQNSERGMESKKWKIKTQNRPFSLNHIHPTEMGCTK